MLNLLVLSHLVETRLDASGSSARCGCSAPRLEQIGRAVPMMAAALSIYTGRPAADRDRQRGRTGGDARSRVVARSYLPFAITV